MSKRYIADRFLPDKAIDVIDEAGARLRLRHDSPEMGEKGKALTKELGEVKKKKESAAKAEDFLKAQVRLPACAPPRPPPTPFD